MKLKKRKSKKFRRGSILGLVLVIGLCLALLGMGMLQMGFGSRVNSHISFSIITARETADAGCAKALYSLNQAFPGGGAFPLTGSGTLDNSNASYSYTITRWLDSPMRGNYYSHYLIESIGTSDRLSKKVYAITGITNMFDYGLIVTDKIDLKSNTFIDGYNSYMGTYRYGDTLPDGTLNLNQHVKIGTTSIDDNMIVLHSGVEITGDVLVGIDGDLKTVIQEPSEGAITGPRYNLPEPWSFDLDLLKNPVLETDPVLGDIDRDTFDASGQYYYKIDNTGGIEPLRYRVMGNIDIPTSTPVPTETYRIVILGDVELHVLGDIGIGTRSLIYIGGDPLADPPVPPVPSSLKIYLDGNLQAGNSNGINNLSEVPANFRLFGTGSGGQDWDIQNGGDFYGAYYAPNADITIYAKGEIYGSVSGRSFELKAAPGVPNAGLHYDIALAGLIDYDIGFGIDSWWEE